MFLLKGKEKVYKKGNGDRNQIIRMVRPGQYFGYRAYFANENYGYETNSTTLNIYLSREDLANLSNMTTSNAIRTLTTFATENLITVDGRKIIIINEEELRRISKYG